MSVKLSENTFNLVRSRFTAVVIADQSASASTIRGELISSFVSIPCAIRLFVAPVMIHAKPAFFVCLFQAASDLQIGVASRSSWGRWITAGAGTTVSFFDFFGSCARFHSLAKRIPFVAVSSGDRVLSSKMRVFRAFHMDQQTHGSILFEIPVGWRQFTLLKATKASLKSSYAAMWTTLWRGILLHTSLAKGQWKKVWHIVSCSLHLTHTAYSNSRLNYYANSPVLYTNAEPAAAAEKIQCDLSKLNGTENWSGREWTAGRTKDEIQFRWNIQRSFYSSFTAAASRKQAGFVTWVMWLTYFCHDNRLNFSRSRWSPRSRKEHG